jgi:hypothetical protein
MVSLAVNNIPLTLDDSVIDARCEIIVLVARPCTYSANLLALEFLESGELATHICRQNSNIYACRCQSPPHLIDVRFKTSYIGDVACCYEQ